MIQNCFCEILQNLHFADNRKDDKTDRVFKTSDASDRSPKFEIFQGAIK